MTLWNQYISVRGNIRWHFNCHRWSNWDIWSDGQTRKGAKRFYDAVVIGSGILVLWSCCHWFWYTCFMKLLSFVWVSNFWGTSFIMLLSLVLVYLFYEAVVFGSGILVFWSCCPLFGSGQQFLRYKFYYAAVIGSGQQFLRYLFYYAAVIGSGQQFLRYKFYYAAVICLGQQFLSY